MRTASIALLLLVAAGCQSFRADQVDVWVATTEGVAVKGDEIADSYESMLRSLMRVTPAESPTAQRLIEAQAAVGEWRAEFAEILNELARSLISAKGLTDKERADALATLFSIIDKVKE